MSGGHCWHPQIVPWHGEVSHCKHALNNVLLGSSPADHLHGWAGLPLTRPQQGSQQLSQSHEETDGWLPKEEEGGATLVPTGTIIFTSCCTTISTSSFSTCTYVNIFSTFNICTIIFNSTTHTKNCLWKLLWSVLNSPLHTSPFPWLSSTLSISPTNSPVPTPFLLHPNFLCPPHPPSSSTFSPFSCFSPS